MNTRTIFITGTLAGRSGRRDLSGAALVIVLGFIVMLLTLLMAYFSRGVLQNQISISSSNIVREDLLARSAIDSVISDLKGEIADGSTITHVGAGSSTSTLCFPLTNTNMVPAISGNQPRGSRPPDR